MPEMDELVLITVKKIMPYGAFCALDEYGGKEAFVHISEVAPRWIKNIHEFLSEGAHLVAKVYHIDAEKGQIDISLKRVNESERKAKTEGSRREKRATKLFEIAVKLAKSTKSEEIAARAALTQKYGTLIDAMETISEKGEEAVTGLKIEKGLVKALLEVASKGMRKARAEINGAITLVCYLPDGVDAIKKILAAGEIKPQLAVKGATAAESQGAIESSILYLGAPKYQIKVIADDFKAAEKTMEKIVGEMEKAAKANKADFEYARMEA
jgi:translation initiation factor 2 subunit 1